MTTIELIFIDTIQLSNKTLQEVYYMKDGFKRKALFSEDFQSLDHDHQHDVMLPWIKESYQALFKCREEILKS